jgi:cell wall-associated NlpC family hydrolase
MTEPKPGDFGLTKIKGLAGAFVNFGQWFVGDFAPVQHALVYVGNGLVVQAMPSGAELIRLEDASPVVKWSTGLVELNEVERWKIALKATELAGTPYSFLDYVSIALKRLGVPSRLIRDRVRDSGHLICSQLVVEAYRRAGIELFGPDTFPGDYTPGDLWKLLKEMEADARVR